MAPHADGCRRLSVLVSGEQEESHRRSNVQAAFASVALKGPESIHSNRFGESGATIVSVQLPDEALVALGYGPDTLVPWRWLAGGPVSLLGLRLAVGLRLRDGAVIEESLLEILARFSPAGDRDSVDAPERVRRIRDRLHDEPDIAPSVRRLAAAEGIHPVSLGRSFRRVFGCSITQYRQRIRAAVVARALVCGDEPLVEVALDHGFSDSSHMTRLFRREIGVPPAHFRAQLGWRAGGLESFKTEWHVEV